jgi:hypothetical protein
MKGTYYLAGPMRGKDKFNFPAFFECESYLTEEFPDIKIVSPAKHDMEVFPDFDYESNDLSGFDFETAFKWDLHQVIEADGVILIPGWEKSEGCAVELATARLMDKKAYVCRPLGDPLLKELPRGDTRFHRLLRVIGALHDQKQADYGTTEDPFANVRSAVEFGVPSWVGSLIRMNDKMNRLKTFSKKGELQNESALDSMLDIAVYGLITAILYEEDDGNT